MRFQERDGLILFAMDDYGGVLARRHLQDLFWPEASLRAMLQRLSLLVEHEYLARPTRYQWRTEPIPEAVYWLGWKGAAWLAAERGFEFSLPKNSGENQMRLFQRSLREQGMRWLREPRWDKLRHDLLAVDFRLMLEQSVIELPSVNLEKWVGESEFRSRMDRVEFTFEGKGGKVEKGERGVCPDGYFVIADEQRRQRGENHRLPCLLEIDMATHDNPRFGREKAAPYAAYIKSPAYKTRFGLNSGVWLVVTSGKRRLQNLMRSTTQVVSQDTRYFFFTYFAELEAANILTDPIWYQVGQEEPKSLLFV